MEHKTLRGGRQGADRLGDPLVGSQCIGLLGVFRTVLVSLIQADFVKSKSSRSASFGAVLQGWVKANMIASQLDPRGNIVDRLVLRGIHHPVDPLILQCGVEGLRPGTHPVTPPCAPPRVGFRRPRDAPGTSERCTDFPCPSGRSSRLSQSGTCVPPYRWPRTPGTCAHGSAIA